MEFCPNELKEPGLPPVGTIIDLCIALNPHHGDALINALYEVSNPGHLKHILSTTLHMHVLTCATASIRYGVHLFKKQVTELVASHLDTLELAVNSWLGHHSISSSTSTTHSNWLMLKGMPVSKANGLLIASFHLYQHADMNNTVLHTVSYALSMMLHAHVEVISKPWKSL